MSLSCFSKAIALILLDTAHRKPIPKGFSSIKINCANNNSAIHFLFNIYHCSRQDLLVVGKWSEGGGGRESEIEGIIPLGRRSETGLNPTPHAVLMYKSKLRAQPLRSPSLSWGLSCQNEREAKLQMRLRFSISFAVGTQGPAGVPNTDCVTQALKDTRKKACQQKWI